jgi:hypothetical protein
VHRTVCNPNASVHARRHIDRKPQAPCDPSKPIQHLPWALNPPAGGSNRGVCTQAWVWRVDLTATSPCTRAYPSALRPSWVMRRATRAVTPVTERRVSSLHAPTHARHSSHGRCEHTGGPGRWAAHLIRVTLCPMTIDDCPLACNAKEERARGSLGSPSAGFTRHVE